MIRNATAPAHSAISARPATVSDNGYLDLLGFSGTRNTRFPEKLVEKARRPRIGP